MSMLGVDHTVQMSSRVFDVEMLVLAGPAFCSEDAAAVGICEIAVWELIMSFRIFPILVVNCQIPLTVFKEPMPLEEFIFLPRGRLVFAPRVSLVVYELTLIDEPLGMLVCSVVQSNCHDPGLLVRGRLGYRLDRVANASPCARYCWNHSRANRATSSNLPGSSNRCVAPGTITSRFSQRS
jgi:hypothetical protein